MHSVLLLIAELWNLMLNENDDLVAIESVLLDTGQMLLLKKGWSDNKMIAAFMQPGKGL